MDSVASVRPLRPGDPEAVGSPAGTYVITGRIGQGGMGVVYLGQTPDGRKVAVKVVQPELAADEEFIARFRDEVANARRVASFCTAQVLDQGEYLGRPFMITEYVEGSALSAYVTANGALPPAMLHGVAVGVAAALVAIHATGLVHRDLKPANVLLSMSGPRVIDFGIARATDAMRHTLTGQMIGSPGWMAPEQLLNHPITPAVDIFSWGCLVAYAGIGRHPYGEGDPLTLAARVLHAQPEIGPLDAPLDRLVRTALAHDPAQRPTAQDLLLSLVGGTGAGAVQGSLTSVWQAAAPTAPATPPGGVPRASAGQQLPGTAPYPGPPTGPHPGVPTAGHPGPPTGPHPGPGTGPRPYPFPDGTGPRPTVATPTVGMPPDGTVVNPTERVAPGWTPHGGTRPQQPGVVYPAPPPPRKTGRWAVIGVAAVVFLLVGALVAWLSLRDKSQNTASSGGSSTTATPSPTADPNALPTDEMLVRLDKAPGWPGECHATVAVMKPKQNPRPLLDGGSCDILPQWSHDHTKIAFTRKVNNVGEAWVMDANGNNPRRVAKLTGPTRVAWSPDGTKLAVMDLDSKGVQQVKAVRVDGQSAGLISESDVEVLTTDGSEKDDPAWSPDGKKIAFWSAKSGQSQIYLLDVGKPTAAWTPVTTDKNAPNGAVDPVWSPDGKQIAYTFLNQNGQADIYVIGADGSTPHAVAKTAAHEMDPTWSPNGVWVAYVVGPFADPRVWAARAKDGSGAELITGGDQAQGHPSWS